MEKLMKCARWISRDHNTPKCVPRYVLDLFVGKNLTILCLLIKSDKGIAGQIENPVNCSFVSAIISRVTYWAIRCFLATAVTISNIGPRISKKKCRH